VGNGFCDDGRVQPWGASDFACPAFGWDGGDCDAPESLPDPDTDAADTEPADTDTTDTELTDTDTTDTEPADTDTPPALPDTGLPASP
jgi:hypothetical protein